MKLPPTPLLLVVFAATASLSQGTTPQTCTREMIADDDCIAVIDANACYNEYRWNAQTLQCIDGKDNADRQRKACKCCSCVGTVMCNWVKSQRFSCAS
ncbi:hypothetical protein F5Y17DRAFT_424560 [Xylariaceae sp. FL0594]|nr:hypothetical protein F5Y17DRAFT_424560 [Xylariaceae sp. FL0594]